MAPGKARIALTGPTGGLGSSVLKHILRFIDDPARLIVCQYNPSKPTDALTSQGLEVRRADYNDPATLDTAFAGAQVLFLVSYPSIAYEARVRAHKNAIDAAKRAGVQRILYTSIVFCGDASATESLAYVFKAHRDTEAYLKASGVGYTVVREALYVSIHYLYLGFFRPEQEEDAVIRVPDDGGRGVAFAVRDELGEATARLVLQALPDSASAAADADPAEFENTVVLLTGPEPVSVVAAAAAMARVTGRPLEVEFVTDEEFVARAPPFPPSFGEDYARRWGTSFQAFRAGECAVVDPLLERLLGRKPTGYLDGLILDLKG